jgi:cell division septum initiation protein DivIVA
MAMGTLEWGLQLVVAALLAAALPYVLRLERELRALRRDRAALDGSAAGLAEATRLAEAASLRLRASAESAGRQIAEKLAAAEPLRDDLQYLIERAEAIADRLDGAVRTARGAILPRTEDAPAAVPASAFKPSTASAGATQPGRSRAERDLMRALNLGASTGGGPP